MIIDFHTHVFPERIAAATVAALAKSANATPYSDGTVAGLLSSLNAAGVSLAVNLPVLTKPRQFDGILRFAEELNREKADGAQILSFAGIHPDEEDIEGRLDAVLAFGIKGVKIHPDYQGRFIDDERYVRIVSYAKRLGLIVVTHAGLDGAYVGQPIKCTPERVLRLLDRVGGYSKLVLAHIGGAELSDQVLELLAGEDVYFDTAFSLPKIGEGMFKKILEKHGDERILFATDSPWRDIARDVEIMKGYSLGKETENRIFSENAIKLLGLKI